ncbi:MAG TPA: flagellar biosynthesis anti-sigma factor FlgM [Polyangiaceae bacterium]|nr:flagellar biosynthesis anti-sigma factor FlgM [Polyangiaceae bacterium]
MKPINGNPAYTAYQRMAVSAVGAGQPATPVQKVKPAAPARAADVHISDRARELLNAEGAGNSERIAALKAQVADGSFEVDLRRVAERMLERSG